MPSVEISIRQVFREPTKGRSYLTARSAAHAEARALIEAKYPTEGSEYDDDGRTTYGGWHWSSDKKLVKAHGRLAKRILRKLRSDAKRAAGEQG